MALKEYTDKYVHAVKHQPHTLQRVLDVFHMLAYLAPVRGICKTCLGCPCMDPFSIRSLEWETLEKLQQS